MSSSAYKSSVSGGSDDEARDSSPALSAHLAAKRAELGWSLAEVASRSGLSRAYVNAIERGRSSRPSAETVRRIESAIGPITPGDPVPPNVPVGLLELAADIGIPESEVAAMSTIRVRGRQPQSRERWQFIYQALLASESMETSAST